MLHSSVETSSAIFCHCRQKRERGKILKSPGRKYDVVIQRDAVTDHDVPRVPRRLNPADPAVPADTRSEKPQTRDAQPHGNRAGISDDAIG
jgi:hypothetical protein